MFITLVTTYSTYALTTSAYSISESHSCCSFMNLFLTTAKLIVNQGTAQSMHLLPFVWPWTEGRYNSLAYLSRHLELLFLINHLSRNDKLMTWFVNQLWIEESTQFTYWFSVRVTSITNLITQFSVSTWIEKQHNSRYLVISDSDTNVPGNNRWYFADYYILPHWS